MRITKRNATDERRVLIGMIVDDHVLGRINSKWQPDLFKSKYANLIARWCIEFYKQYEKAPQGNIESLFETWERKNQDEATASLVNKLLSSISNEYEELQEESNSEYIIDVAGRYFNRVKIERLSDDVQSNLDVNRIDDAHKLLIDYNRIEMGLGAGIDFFQDEEAVKEAFKTKQKSLIKYPGALGKFFANNLGRGDFVTFLGRKKIGKSFWLMDIAYRGVLNRKRVAYFEVGDMGQNSTIVRLCQRVARHPKWRSSKIHYPTAIRHTKESGTQTRYEIKKFDRGLNSDVAYKALQRIVRKKIKSKQPYLKLSCHPNSSLSVVEIESILNEWEIEDWIPDIIVIDYADILKMDHSGYEGRDRINETWKQLRRLSQQHHALVVTATQADAESIEKNLLSMRNFSEDNRKIDHVTGMIGINQNNKEKRQGVTRLNWLALRDDEYDAIKCVYVAGCFSLANPAVVSCFQKK